MVQFKVQASILSGQFQGLIPFVSKLAGSFMSCKPRSIPSAKRATQMIEPEEGGKGGGCSYQPQPVKLHCLVEEFLSQLYPNNIRCIVHKIWENDFPHWPGLQTNGATMNELHK